MASTSIELLFVFSVFFTGRNFILISLFRSLRFLLPTTVRLLLSVLFAVVELRFQFECLSFSYLGNQSFAILLLVLPFLFASEAILIDGRLSDVYRGTQFAEQNFLREQQRTTLLEQVSVFLSAYFLILVAESFFELYQYTSSTVPKIPFMGNRITELFSEALLLGVLLSAPCYLVAMSVDCIAAFANKQMPRVSFLFELFPVKLIACIWLYTLRLDDTPLRAIHFTIESIL